MKQVHTGRPIALITAGLLVHSAAVAQQAIPEPPYLPQVGLARVSATYDMEVVPPYLYALDRGILYVLDARDPSAVREVTTLEFDEPYSRIELRPPFLYLYGYDRALGIVDVSDPTEPRWVRADPQLLPVQGGSFRIVGEDHAVLVRNLGEADRANPARPRAAWSGPLVLDVLDLKQDPSRPQRIGSVDLGLNAGGDYGSITHAAGRIYMVVSRVLGEDRRSQLVVVDVRDPQQPRVERRHHFEEKRYHKIAVRGDLLYLLQRGQQEAAENGLAIYRLPVRGDLEFLGEAKSTLLWVPQDLILHGDVAYASFKGTPTFATFDISDPRRPRILHSYMDVQNDMWMAGLGMALAENRLYVTGDPGPSSIFDVTVPEAPRLMGRWEHYGGLIRQIVRSDSLAIVASMTDLLFYDVSDPGRPRQLGRHMGVPRHNAGGVYQWNVVVGAHGTTAVVAYETIPAEVLDISNPAAPRVLGRFAPRGLVHAVETTPTHAFLGYNAVVEGRAPRLFDPATLAQGGGIEVISLREHAQPKSTGVLEFEQAVTGLARSGDRLVAAHVDGSLTVVDVGDPDRPRVLGRLAGSGERQYPWKSASVALSSDGSRAYLSHAQVGPEENHQLGGPATLSIVGLGDPAAPTVISRREFQQQGGWGVAAAIAGDRLALVQGFQGGVRIFDVSDPAQPVVVAHQPLELIEAIALDPEYLYAGPWEVGILTYRLPPARQPVDLP
jgi:hypothetical protein